MDKFTRSFLDDMNQSVIIESTLGYHTYGDMIDYIVTHEEEKTHLFTSSNQTSNLDTDVF